MSWIQVRTVETLVTNSIENILEYHITFEVIGSQGISPALFVLSRSTDAYSHPATVYDLNTFPTLKVEAVQQNLDFYRVSSVNLVFFDKVGARAAATEINRRLQRTNREWQETNTTPFGGTSVVMFDSGEV
jgi:hypothetical protein